MLRSVLRVLLAVAMIYVGVLHFARPGGFVTIVPSYLPAPLTLVLVSGFFEVLGGIGLLVPRVRRAASYGLVALYIAVFPANVNMAVHHLPFGDSPTPEWLLLLRLPLQIVLIVLALYVGKTPPAPSASDQGSR
jgi:uncharacterized membrane protein